MLSKDGHQTSLYNAVVAYSKHWHCPSSTIRISTLLSSRIQGLCYQIDQMVKMKGLQSVC